MRDPSKIVSFILLLLITMLSYSLFIGKGGWLRIRNLNQQISQQRDANVQQKTRNDALTAEVRDLKKGTDALEEHARTDLGMVRQGETFYRYVPPPSQNDSQSVNPAAQSSKNK
ncbi:MAG: cell division protein FtsB [Ferrovum sp. 37-45-19]|nr:MAG: cell division protein FtsB [Ferrovum sp. 37-45-19]